MFSCFPCVLNWFSIFPVFGTYCMIKYCIVIWLCIATLKSSRSCPALRTWYCTLLVRLRLRVLPGCAAGYNSVFVSTKRRAPHEHAVQKTWLKMGSRAVGILTKRPPSRSSTASYQTHPLHVQWREPESPEAAIGPGPPLSIHGHRSGLSTLLP